MLIRSTLAACIALFGGGSIAAVPVLSGDVGRAECHDALTLARAMFDSSAKRLYAPMSFPAAMRSRLVLGAPAPDISDGDALQASDDFDKIPQDIRSTYWARHAQQGRRLVVSEIARGWRGDTYSVHLIDEALTPDEFLRSPSAAPVIEHAWRPPAVFRSTASGALWFVDVGQPFEIWPDWRIFALPAEQPVCRVHFRDPLKDPAELLPEAVRALLPLLNEAIGPGADEGTLQQTARLRLHVRHVLANAALRPWAVSDADAYNTRETVDAGLQDWARETPEQAATHRALLAGQADAERALAGHYAAQFELPPDQAEALAVWMLDVVIRAHFVFPRGAARPGHARPNPWPAGSAAREQ